MFQIIKGEYGDSKVWVDKPRADPPAVEKVRVTKYLRETGWTMEMLEHAISQYGHPKPCGLDISAPRLSHDGFLGGQSESVYSRSQIAAWRDRLTADLRALAGC